jgi:hypothetical protein
MNYTKTIKEIEREIKQKEEQESINAYFGVMKDLDIPIIVTKEDRDLFE